MLLHHSRRLARVDTSGSSIQLENQDRTLWDADRIEEGCELVEAVLRVPFPGPYSLQAAIAAVHAEAKTPESTGWQQIVALYGLLNARFGIPIIELNRAVAISMAEGPIRGLRLGDWLTMRVELHDYYLLYAVKADLFRRLHKYAEARTKLRRSTQTHEKYCRAKISRVTNSSAF